MHVRNPITESEGLAKWLAQRKFLTSELDASSSSEMGYKNGRCASLAPPPSGRAKADARYIQATPVLPSRRDISPWLRPGVR